LLYRVERQNAAHFQELSFIDGNPRHPRRPRSPLFQLSRRVELESVRTRMTRIAADAGNQKDD
jgi:hypothetical protein